MKRNLEISIDSPFRLIVRGPFGFAVSMTWKIELASPEPFDMCPVFYSVLSSCCTAEVRLKFIHRDGSRGEKFIDLIYGVCGECRSQVSRPLFDAKIGYRPDTFPSKLILDLATAATDPLTAVVWAQAIEAEISNIVEEVGITYSVLDDAKTVRLLEDFVARRNGVIELDLVE